MIKNKLIGFDIRFLSDDFLLQRWSASIRDQYLLKSNIPLPLSIDRSVWPSRFKIISDQSINGLTLDDISSTSTRHNQYFVCYDIWNDLNEMISQYKPVSKGKDYGIAINLIIPDNIINQNDEWLNSIINSPSCSPSVPNQEWLFFGYDIANSSFSSMLFRFGLKEEEKRNMRPIWSRYLNDYGLIKTEEKAIEFWQNGSNRMIEDSPFYIFQLFLICGELCGMGDRSWRTNSVW
ncbi:MAG: hypothetical protein JRE64_16790 [Deltaproteobacteria bacterium]|nr:hypothetical protein [Deltaproteobacteria bacterium]